MAFIFKEGDKVYFPAISSEILTVENLDVSGHPEIELGELLRVRRHPSVHPIYSSFFKNGMRGVGDKIPSVFHATEENRIALTQLYGIEFGKP